VRNLCGLLGRYHANPFCGASGLSHDIGFGYVRKRRELGFLTVENICSNYRLGKGLLSELPNDSPHLFGRHAEG
jgi:hypothetical protein